MNEEDKKIIERWNRPLTAKEVIEKANRYRLHAKKMHQKTGYFGRIFGIKIRLY